MSDIHQGDIGTRLILQLYDNGAILDVSSASSKQIKFCKPDGTTTTKTAQLLNTGTDGQIYYAADASFLDMAGRWQMQAIVTITGNTYHSSIEQFDVETNL